MDTGAERMIEIIMDEHGIFLGDSQVGKTTTAIYICQLQNAKGYTTVFVNSKDDKKLYTINGLKQGGARYIDVSLEQFAYLLEQKVTDGIIEIRPKLSEENLIAQIEPYLKTLLNWKRRNPLHPVFCCVDEVHLYQSKMSLISSLKNCVVMGKGLNLYMGLLSQRPTQIHNDLFTQTEYYFIQGLNSRDLKYLYENRYLAIPEGWILPLNDPACTYPWKHNKHRLFFQQAKFDGLLEITPLNKPPF